ncbi:YqhG family protein [Brevibacillus ruminantium]|uniref:YqhG family protein n=1 Tax=Brevibacillus ruminantium TaxID=2950604 RepID=A0ABY4WA09_9BACL|nr:YqhG family protein [Brevibacillus ruminantium]USG63676.1 YqhG family protein [Brevibacillus ruminantium]
MKQQQVREYVEQYLAAFSSHIMETHPDYLTVKLPVEVDKDIGNRPFYWSWVEKMNLPYQPLVMTFCFHPERIPSDRRAEHLHLGAARLQQIFQSVRKHGSFVCMYETAERGTISPSRRSSPLVPWLGINWKVSFICDKKRDLLLHFGVNLHDPQIVDGFYPFLLERSLSPSIPDYHYTLDRRISIEQAFGMMQEKINQMLADLDQTWAAEAKQRLDEELEILEVYYRELEERQTAPTAADESPEPSEEDEKTDGMADLKAKENPAVKREQSLSEEDLAGKVLPSDVTQAQDEPIASLDDHLTAGGRILDFLRANSFQQTPREKIDQTEWKASTPQEEKLRRMDEMRWQYEPRIRVQFINGGLFYLQSSPPMSGDLPNWRKM